MGEDDKSLEQTEHVMSESYYTTCAEIPTTLLRAEKKEILEK